MSAAGAEIWFYHLERSSLDQVLPELLEKTLGRGWRALVHVRDQGLRDAVDERLWTWRADSFLPHGQANDERKAVQPILLSDSLDNANGAQALFVVDGGELGDLAGYERCLVIFDGRDDAALARAREQWKQVKAGGNEASYWRQTEEGGWSRAA
jgi:DNA polymerase-3 subunit chi